MTKEHIISAAVLRNDAVLVEDKDHSNCINKSPAGTCVGEGVIQGFMTSERRFVEREEAAEVAFKAKQIDYDPTGEKLYSEDILHSGYCSWDNTLKRYTYNINSSVLEDRSFLIISDIMGGAIEPTIKFVKSIIPYVIFTLIVIGIISIPAAAIKYLLFN